MDRGKVKVQAADEHGWTHCQYCEDTDAPCCTKSTESGYGCTRDANHDGPCVACGTQEHDLDGVAGGPATL